MRLRKLIKKGKGLSTSHTTKLPSIRDKSHNSTEQDILVLWWIISLFAIQFFLIQTNHCIYNSGISCRFFSQFNQTFEQDKQPNSHHNTHQHQIQYFSTQSIAFLITVTLKTSIIIETTIKLSFNFFSGLASDIHLFHFYIYFGGVFSGRWFFITFNTVIRLI